MQISELRNELEPTLHQFAWDQWAQMGVFAGTKRQDRWAADPEALLLFTFEVGRSEPRLFDEVLDWLVVNESLISLQRLRNLRRDEEDRMLAGGVLAWVADQKPRSRFATSSRATRRERTTQRSAQPLFRNIKTAVSDPDSVFLEHGFLRQHVITSQKSVPPDIQAPINFAFRMRQLLGMGARAEVARIMLTINEERLSAQTIAHFAGYSRRNVQDALISLRKAGVVDAVTISNEQRYTAPRERWASMLGLREDELPEFCPWPQLLYILRVLWRWLENPANQNLSEYMLASSARTLTDQMAPGLALAGISGWESSATGEEYWGDFVELAGHLVDFLK